MFCIETTVSTISNREVTWDFPSVYSCMINNKLTVLFLNLANDLLPAELHQIT